MSLPQIVDARICTTTWPGPGAGSVTSRISTSRLPGRNTPRTQPTSTRPAPPATCTVNTDGGSNPAAANASVTAVVTEPTRGRGTSATADPPKPPPVIRAPTAPAPTAAST